MSTDEACKDGDARKDADGVHERSGCEGPVSANRPFYTRFLKRKCLHDLLGPMTFSNYQLECLAIVGKKVNTILQDIHMNFIVGSAFACAQFDREG